MGHAILCALLLAPSPHVAAAPAYGLGIRQPSRGVFTLRPPEDSGLPDIQVTFFGGPKAAFPIAGDWDGDGTSTIGLYQRRTRTFSLKDRNVSGPADREFRLRKVPKASFPIAGDWNGDGQDTIGVYDAKTARFLLRQTNTTGRPDMDFQFEGAARTWLPLTGDWDGDGVSSVGLFDPATGRFYLRNSNSTGPADKQVRIGAPDDTRGWLPVAGDWDGDGVATIGLFEPRTGLFRLRNQNSDGPADIELIFEGSTPRTRPVAGVWSSNPPNGAAQLCVDTINAYRASLSLAPLRRALAAEPCADRQADSDASTGRPHGAFGQCGEYAQNECPDWPGPPTSMIGPCLQMMWDEGPGADYSRHGHYLNMSNPAYTEVACGFHQTPGGRVWSIQDFR